MLLLADVGESSFANADIKKKNPQNSDIWILQMFSVEIVCNNNPIIRLRELSSLKPPVTQEGNHAANYGDLGNPPDRHVDCFLHEILS